MTPVDRRHFLKNSAALAASLAVLEATSTRAAEPDADTGGKKAGANDVIRLAMIGVRSRGMEHIAGYSKLKDVKITHICDAESSPVCRPNSRAAAVRHTTSSAR